MVKEIATLTGLRGFAALWVCIFHYTLLWTSYDNWAMPLARYGNYGVSVFFVLSGFILSYVYRSWFHEWWIASASRYRQFLWHRFARVYPLHALTLFLAASLMIAGVMPVDKYDTALTFVLNLLLLHGWGYPDSVSWNSPSWTISVEMFAYLLFPLLIGPFCRSPAIVLALVGIAAFFGDTYYLKLLAAHGFDLAAAQFSYGIYLVRYFCMFVFGMLAFQVWLRLAPRIKPDWPFDVVTALALAWIIGRGVYQGHPNEIFYASALLIFGLSRDSGWSKILMGNRAAVLLGDWSYALYLSHIILLFVMWRFIRGLGLSPVDLPLVPAILAAIALAGSLHYGFERPVRLMLRRAVRGEAVSPARSVAL